MNLNTRHLAIIGASAIGTMNIAVQGSIEITTGALGIMGLAFAWDKIEKNIGKSK